MEYNGLRIIRTTDLYANTYASDAESGLAGYAMFRKYRLGKGKAMSFYVSKN